MIIILLNTYKCTIHSRHVQNQDIRETISLENVMSKSRLMLSYDFGHDV